MMKKWRWAVLASAVFILLGAFNTAQAASGANGAVRVTAIQSNGKIIIGGDFTSYNDVARNGIARLDANGNLDNDFNPSSKPCGNNGYIKSLIVQADDKILVGCNVTNTSIPYDGGLLRFNSNGTVDEDFKPELKGNVNSISIQQPEKIIIGGNFTFSDNATSYYVARLDIDGGIDDTFSQYPGINSDVNAIAIQSDGNILIAGSGLIRLTENGDVDPTFNVNGSHIQNGRKEVRTVALQLDGKIIIGGNFQLYLSDSGIFINNIARLYNDGSLDFTFSLNAGNISAWVGFVGANTTGYVNTASVGSDGKIIITGSFGNINVLNEDGKINFDRWGENGPILTSTSQSNGKFIIGGDFTTFNYIPANRIARLDINGMLDTTFNSEVPVELCSILELKDNSFIPDSSTKDHLVVITHGWDGHGDDEWITNMRSNMCNNVDDKNTTIASFDWSDRADTGGEFGKDTFNPLETKGSANGAYYNAEMAGHFLALKIEELSEQSQVKYLHLVAHSAGSRVIQTATDDLAVYAQEHPYWLTPYVHLTFLDAYALNGENETYGDLHDFSGYAEQYFDANINPITGDFPLTNIRLHNAVNFDITNLVVKSGRTHGWPNIFYTMSATSSEFQYPDLGSSPFRLGFPFSVESSAHIKPDVRNGQLCVVTDVSKPYERCSGLVEKFISTEDHDEIPGDGVVVNVMKYFEFEYNGELDRWMGNGTIPALNMINPDIAEVRVPQTQASITDLDINNVWDGNIMTPKIVTDLDSDIYLVDSNGNPLPSSELSSSNSLAIDIGSENAKLVFDKGVRIKMINQAGKQVSYSQDGKTFTRIDRICDVDSQEVGDALPPVNECKIDVGSDLVIWTKHLTTFVTYAPDTIVPATTPSTFGTGGPDWFRSDVQVTLLAIDNDGGSGVDKTEYSLDGGASWVTYADPFTISSEGTNEVKYRSTDKAGNAEETKSTEIRIDKTAPEITISIPNDKIQYILKSSANAGWSVNDDLSGVETSGGTVSSGNAIDTSSVGEKIFTVTAADVAGNSTEKTVTYNVVYSFGGFLDPIKDGKTFNSKSTIPVRFQLTDAEGQYVSDALASLEVDGEPAVASGNSNSRNSFRYDAQANRYTFNLSLKNSSVQSGKHTLEITLNDGMKFSQEIIVK